MARALLDLDRISKSFGAVEAVRDLSFSLAEGEVLGVMGPNGAGKTTLLNLIMGVYPVDRGEIRFAGERISGLPTSQISRRGIGRTYQIPQPFRQMTVVENLLVGELYAVGHQSMARARASAMTVLTEVGLADRAETPAGQLGLLDLKRLELARALSMRPRLLLLDEIAAGLTEREVAELQRLIGAFKRAGQAILLIDHVLSVMFDQSDRILVMNFGERVAEGRPREIATDPTVSEIYLGAERSQAATATAPPSRPVPLLSLTRASARYREFQALFDVSLEIFEGEIVALVGLNGAGKTTLIRAISKQVPLASGEIRFREVNLSGVATHEIIELGIAQCAEGRRIFPELTVRENLEVGAYCRRARGRRHETLKRVFDLFPILAERQDQLASTLSGGQQQMLAIGRALMAVPALIMFDEISLGLAPVVIDQLYEAVGEINRQGTTVLLVEQNVYRSLGAAHRAYIIERGRIVLSGPAAALRENQRVRDFYFGFERDREADGG